MLGSDQRSGGVGWLLSGGRGRREVLKAEMHLLWEGRIGHKDTGEKDITGQT